MAAFLAFVRLSRLPFLLGGILMTLLGSLTQDSFDWSRFVVAVGAVAAVQLTAHYLNEYADYEADMTIANRTAFSGGSGVLTSDALSPVTALRAGQVTTVLAVVAAPAIATFSVAAAFVVLLGLAVSWTYSMPPMRLLNTGWGELVTALTVAALVPITGALLQSPHIPAGLWWLSASLVCLQLATLLTFELPDLETDKQAGKLVLGVRLGARGTRLAALGALVAAVGIIAIAWLTNRVSGASALLFCLGAPSAVTLVVALRQLRYGLATFSAVATFFLCGVGLTVAQLL